MVYHHDGGNSITQRLCWDEINRLIATSDGSQISHYIYDANGERAMKYNGTLSKQQINQYTLIDYALMDRYTYYPSPLLVFGSNGYSKHYFIEGQRVMSRIGDIWDAEAALIPLDTTPDGVDLNNKADQIEAQLETHLACLALAGEVDYHVDLEWLGWETEPMVFFYHPDHLGSSSFITGATGEPTQHLEYLPFGELFIEERSTWNTPYKFSGKELDDETGYSYFGARYYDPNISIWLSVDPLSDKYPGHSPYTYALNNPVKIIDPNGMSTDWVETTADDGSKQVVWKPEVTKPSDVDPKSGDKYLGKAGYGVENDQLTWYGEDGKKTPTAMSLPEVEINGGEMSDHAKAMRAARELGIHDAQMKFLRGSAELTSSIFTTTGTGLEIAGLYLTMHGGGEIGVPLMGLGRTASGIGTGIDVGLKLTEGDVYGAMASGSLWLSGKAVSSGISRIPKVSELGREILYESALLKLQLGDWIIDNSRK